MTSTSSISTLNYLAQLLESCIGSKSLRQGQIIHQQLLKLNIDNLKTQIPYLDKLTRFYISCKRPQLAHRVFNAIPTFERRRKTILWNQMIRAYAWDGPFDKSVDLYNEMVDSGLKPTKYTYPFVLKACSALQDLEAGLEVHEDAKRFDLDRDLYVCTALVDFYVKCGRLEEAKKLFDEMPVKDVVALNAMVSGFSSQGMCWDAIGLVSKMHQQGVEPNSSTVTAVLPAIAEACRYKEGKSIHGFCLRRSFDTDVVVGTGIIDMYGKCGLLLDARRMFDLLVLKNEVTWCAMVGAFVACDSVGEGFELFRKMRTEIGEKIISSIMIGTLVRGCAKLNGLNIGKQLHAYMIKFGLSLDLMVGNTFLSMYAKCGSISDAVKFFTEMRVKDSVSYSAIISGSVQNGYAEDALKLFRKMQLANVQTERETMMGLLPACSYLAALKHGLCAHGYSVVRGFSSDVSIGNAIIDMYSKCGKINAARLFFDVMCQKDVISWNAMIVGYGIHGRGMDAISLFQEMQNVGPKPDHVTFVALLSACSHSGLVSEGKHLFLTMSQEYNIVPNMDHYFCMVDLLGRAGLLQEAYKFIGTMPFQPDSHLWNALLASCRIHKDIELAEEVSRRIYDLGPASPGNFVLLFNLYSNAQRWDDAANVRIQQKTLGFRKKPGCSWIEVNRTVHAFLGGGCCHQQSAEIYKKLEELNNEIKQLGYTTERSFVYQDVEEEEKEKILMYHSEKLAVAYGIISIKPSQPILVTKNLRVCGDCHAFLKYISIITKREITVRDVRRFHHFNDGHCSCKEFW